MTTLGNDVCSQTFDGTPASVRTARCWARELLQGAGLVGQSADDAVTCISELATNAVMHSHSGWPGGAYQIALTLKHESLCIEVTDQGGDDSPHIPPRLEPGDELGGRGLMICSRLGVVDHHVTDDGHCQVRVRLSHSPRVSGSDSNLTQPDSYREPSCHDPSSPASSTPPSLK